jgi:hypothetical protein
MFQQLFFSKKIVLSKVLLGTDTAMTQQITGEVKKLVLSDECSDINF